MANHDFALLEEEGVLLLDGPLPLPAEGLNVVVRNGEVHSDAPEPVRVVHAQAVGALLRALNSFLLCSWYAKDRL